MRTRSINCHIATTPFYRYSLAGGEIGKGGQIISKEERKNHKTQIRVVLTLTNLFHIILLLFGSGLCLCFIL